MDAETLKDYIDFLYDMYKEDSTEDRSVGIFSANYVNYFHTLKLHNVNVEDDEYNDWAPYRFCTREEFEIKLRALFK